jgi:hypothetical protein
MYRLMYFILKFVVKVTCMYFVRNIRMRLLTFFREVDNAHYCQKEDQTNGSKLPAASSKRITGRASVYVAKTADCESEAIAKNSIEAK